MTEAYKEQIRHLMLDEAKFMRLTMKGRPHDSALPWRQVIVRPVLIKKDRHLQFSYFTEKQDITRNYRGFQASEKLDEILALPFNAISVQSRDSNLHVQITKKGRAIVHREKADVPEQEPNLAHNA